VSWRNLARSAAIKGSPANGDALLISAARCLSSSVVPVCSRPDGGRCDWQAEMTSVVHKAKSAKRHRDLATQLRRVNRGVARQGWLEEDRAVVAGNICVPALCPNSVSQLEVHHDEVHHDSGVGFESQVAI